MAQHATTRKRWRRSTATPRGVRSGLRALDVQGAITSRFFREHVVDGVRSDGERGRQLEDAEVVDQLRLLLGVVHVDP